MYRYLTSLYLFLGLCCCQLQPAWAQTMIGQWQSWLPSLPAIAVTGQGNSIYCATATGLFLVNTADGQDITRYSKVNGLHDIGISAIAANEHGILVAYRNCNLDFLSGSNSYNIPDFQRKQVAADKTIFSIYFSSSYAYLCTGLGIVVVNTAVPEISATYVTGSAGDYTPVYALTIQDNRLYAATAEGVLSAPLTGSNPADFRNWQPVGQLTDTVRNIITFAQQLICQQGQQLYRLENDSWTPFYTDGQDISSLTAQGQQLVACEQQRIVTLQADGAVTATLQDALLKAPRQSFSDGQVTWVADSLTGLLRYDGQGFTAVSPNGPASVITGDLFFLRNTLYAAAGGVSDSWTATNNNNGYYTFNQGEWQQFAGLKDLITLAADPAGDGIYAGSFGGGLLHVANNGSTQLLRQGEKISGLTTDASGNLWAASYGITANLLMKKPDDTWTSFRSPYAQTENAISQLLADNNGQIWMVSPKSNGLFVFNTNSQQWRQYRLGSLPSNDVYCLAKDKNGSIWVGTGTGIGVISCGDQAATENCNAILPIIQQGSFAGYLFQDEAVQTIAVDGANRKWVGTLNGAWLVNEDGTSIIEQFNTANSPLPGNRIYKIAVDPKSGEVYFATEKGLMSWRGTATEGVAMNKDSVLVFPNPVPPGYTGPIAIRGLATNSLVKITDISGRMVFQLRSTGGQAVWSGTDYTGHRPQSGVYLVFASSEDSAEHLVTKIVFIH